jgi:TolB-like protein/DNA-binding winged helix-turn-helix (wHTH) protein
MSNTQIRQIGDEHQLHFDQYYKLLIREDGSTKLDIVTTKLLCHFLDNQDKIITREALTEPVWGTVHVSDNAINRSISVLRKALGGERNHYITTVPKVGYQFNQPVFELKRPLDTINTEKAPNPVDTEKVPEQRDETPAECGLRDRWFFALGVMGTITVLILTIVSFLFHNQSQNQALDQKPLSAKAINIAVLPFANISDDPSQQLFIDGLCEQMLNRLTRIPGLLVMDNADRPSVQYSLKGNIRKNGDAIRITVQLLEKKTGAYMFSTHFDRTLTDVFAIQTEISEQVASALKLSLIHRNTDYSSALARLDHSGVEQLVIARAQLSENSDESIRQAYTTLKSLNQRYPDTSQILGLLTSAYASLARTPVHSSEYQHEKEIALAKQALALDPANFDALHTLYYLYADVTDLREQAYAVNEALLRHHPGRTKAWRSRLHLMINSVRPCDEIQRFVATIPPGVFTELQLSVINYVLGVCLRSQPLEGIENIQTTANEQALNKAINDTVYFFRLNHDMMYDAVMAKARQRPNQNSLAAQYWAQLAAGAITEAATTKKLIDHSGDDFWPWLTSLFTTVYHISSDRKPADKADFVKLVSKFNMASYFAAALIVQSQQDSDQYTKHSSAKQIVTDYLDNMTAFPINVYNVDESIGLMMLQYHANRQQQSQITAQKLFKKLNRYHQDNLLSFKFRALGAYYLIAKFHCGKSCQMIGNDAKNSGINTLTTLFNADHAWWLNDIAFSRVALSPWADDPVVVEYLSRIEQDRQRFRDGL